MSERLTYKSVEVRAVAVPLKRPVIAKVGSFKEWPIILIDLCTEEGIVGRSYLEPYLKNAARYVIPAIRDLAAALIGKPVSPLENFQLNRRSLNLIGYEGRRADRGVGPGHGGMGCARQGRRHAARRPARRLARAGPRLQQQRSLAHRSSTLWRRKQANLSRRAASRP